MKLNLTVLARSYVLCFGLIGITHVFSLLGILSAIAPSPYLDSWWWHGIMFLAYMILPITAVLADNYVLYVTVAAISLARALAEAFRVFAWSADLYIMLAPACALAAFLSLILAVGKVASEASAEILSLEWSQY